MKTILAIDPGVNGGIAYQIEGTTGTVAVKMPETARDVQDLLLEIIQPDHSPRKRDVVCYIERVQPFRGSPAFAMFKLGKSYGELLGTLGALGIRTILVHPQKWQKPFALGTRSACKSDTEWKNKLKAEAQRRYPDVKVTLPVSDAILMLDYAKHEEAK